MPTDPRLSGQGSDCALLIEPRSPIVVRTGRVGLSGSGKWVFDFPIPGTVAGSVRAAYADANDWDFAQEGAHANLLKAIEVHGPLLARQNVRGGKIEVFYPKPADAIYLKDSYGNSKVYCAHPQQPAGGEGCDLPDTRILPVVLKADALAKPAEGPEFWKADTMTVWLSGSDMHSGPEQCGVAAPPKAVRTHVQMNRVRRAHEDEGLFESAGLDFAPRIDSGKWSDQFVMLARIKSKGLDAPNGCVRRLGADGRTAYFCESNEWPTIPDELKHALNEIKQGEIFRLVLATPAIFSEGWRPRWIEESDPTRTPPAAGKIRVKLIAAALDRWQAYSGWDMEKGHRHAIRRLVPAGAVYWFELLEGSGADLAGLWLKPISDEEQDRRNGFGLALPGCKRELPV